MASLCVCRVSRGTGLSDGDLRHHCVFVECLEELGCLIEIYGITVCVCRVSRGTGQSDRDLWHQCVCRVSRGTGLSDRDLWHHCVFVECLEELGSLIEIYGITVCL